MKLVVGGNDILLDYSKFNFLTMNSNFIELKSINGKREFKQGNYMNLQIIVHLFKYNNPKNKLIELSGLLNKYCTLVIGGVEFATDIFNIYNVTPFYLTSTTKFDYCTIDLFASNYNEKLIKLIYESGEDWITEDGEQLYEE
jgi:hypothetical protein